MNGPVDAALSAALIAFMNGGSRPYPALDEEALAAAVGEDAALALLPQLRGIVRESEDLAVDWMPRSREPWQQVEREMQGRHPELSAEAIEALGRYWSYQMR